MYDVKGSCTGQVYHQVDMLKFLNTNPVDLSFFSFIGLFKCEEIEIIALSSAAFRRTALAFSVIKNEYKTNDE